MHQLTKTERQRLTDGIAAAYSIPFIDDIEDYIWEAIFAHTRKITITDPLTETREKKLFDLVDRKRRIGWSAKALQTNAQPGQEFELVIQRADIFKKSKMLGFPALSTTSAPEILGQALMQHWLHEKIYKDMQAQGVDDARICILLKSNDRSRFTFIEEPLTTKISNNISWRWTDDSKTGLQGWQDKQLKFRWYHRQTQLFERFTVPTKAPVIQINPKRLPLKKIITLLNQELSKT